jgi:putative sterol carrier protein
MFKTGKRCDGFCNFLSDLPTLPSSMKMIRERLLKPSFQESLKGFTKILQFSLTDLREDYVFTLDNGKLANVEKKSQSDANIIITTTNALMESVLNKTENAIASYMAGRIKVKGAMGDLVRLQNLMT